MEKSKFTPGPWIADDPDDFGDITITGPDSALAIAAVVNGSIREITGSSGEQIANGRLIAAAPDLYEALLAMATRHKDSPYLGIARAALSKANGESGE